MFLWAEQNGRKVGTEVFEFDDNAHAIEELRELVMAAGLADEGLLALRSHRSSEA